ncbi:MAG: cupin domain-containing protein [Pseudobdellovibrio sp.]
MIEFYEPFFSLELIKPKIALDSLHWVPYNPRKKILRWGASLTSLDGGISGRPDLDSLFEFNKENGTRYSESDFKVPTQYFEPFNFMPQFFDLGRSHIIRLGSGGFFPYHRDFDEDTFRIIYTISGCGENNFVWIQNNQVIKFQDNSWYYVNTKMIHSVFSFFGSEFAVFNVIKSEKSKKSLIHLMSVK